MDQHYSAFISYKHAPLDIEVAKEIQSRLEHYTIPRSMAKKLGRKKIGRIFRDQEELPITVDLGKDIGEALADADFLIVICSHSTKLSTWVPREIETFLKNHDQSHVLTVLAEGEPSEVIPEILLKSQGPDGRDLEPLSCDYRGSRRQARKTEIPRLAAALLGCSYDELVMRERQYKRKRFTIAASVVGVLAAGAISYLIWSNLQIQKSYRIAQENYERAEANYRQALANQSEYLANESLQSLERQDRTLAVQLALAALPDENNDRPLLSEARYALSRALGIYAPNSLELDDRSGVWSYRTQWSIQDFLTDGEGALYAWDLHDQIYGWDLSSRNALFQVGPAESPVTGIFLGGNGDLFVSEDKGLCALDPRTGEVLWRYEEKGLQTSRSSSDEVWYGTFENAWYPAADGILCVCIERWFQYGWEEDPAASEVWLGVSLLSCTDGSVLRKGAPMKLAATDAECTCMCLSKDGTRFALCLETGEGDDLFLFNSGSLSGRKLALEETLYYIGGLCFTDNGQRLLFHGILPAADGTVPDLSDDSVANVEFLQSLECRALCLDLNSEEPVWRASFTSSQIDRIAPSESGLLLAESEKVPATVYGVIRGSSLCCFDLFSGDLILQADFGDPIVGYDRVTANTDGLLTFLSSGAGGLVYNGLKSFAVVSMVSGCTFSRVLCLGTETGSVELAMTGPKTVIQIEELTEAGFTAFTGRIPADEAPIQSLLLSDHLVVTDSDDVVYAYDLNTGALSASADPKGTLDLWEAKLLGVDPSGSVVIYGCDWEQDRFFLFSPATGELTELRLSQLPELAVEAAHLCGGYLVLVTGSFDEVRLYRYGIEGDRASLVQTLTLPEAFLDSCNASIPDGGFLLFSALSPEEIGSRVLVYDAEAGTFAETALAGSGMAEAFAASPEKDAFAISFSDRVDLLEADGSLRFSVPIPYGSVVGMSFYPGDQAASIPAQLLVLGSDGTLTGYRADSGELCMTVALGIERFLPEIPGWRYDGTTLYLTVSAFYLLYDIDLEQKAVRDIVPCGAAWDPARDRYYLIRANDRTLGYDLGWVPRYSLEELKQKALDYLHGCDMDESTRASYGLGQ